MLRRATISAISVLTVAYASTAMAQAVPGYVPPVTVGQTPNYADDTRGVYVPSHAQHRMRTSAEKQIYLAQANLSGRRGGTMSADDEYAREINRIAGGDSGYNQNGGQQMWPQGGQQMQQPRQGGQHQQMQQPQGGQHQQMQQPQGGYDNMNAGSGMEQAAPQKQMTHQNGAMNNGSPGGGVEIAVGRVKDRTLDMQNSIVRLREDRISIRRAVQRMMDQIGGGHWNVVWDLSEENMALPEMEISLYAEEPFMNILKALLARLQTRSGQPLRVIRYDGDERMVITDRQGAHRLANNYQAVGVDNVDGEAAITERHLKEAMVSLHYDEIPLVDALENIVNQAGKGQWRLRVYAGMDQVLKPAHIEEPFSIAMDRLLRLFNLKYEIFPGGKLVVVTETNRFGFKGVRTQ